MFKLLLTAVGGIIFDLLCVRLLGYESGGAIWCALVVVVCAERIAARLDRLIDP